MAIVPARGLWVDANFKESQLARIREGQSAEIVADVLPGVSFRGRVASLAPATGAQFSVIPPENATGNFTKIIQRVPVRIELEGADAELGKLRPGLSVAVHVDRTAQLCRPRGSKMNVTVPVTVATRAPYARSPPHRRPSTFDERNALAFGIMCLGCFIAYLDIQIVSASIQEIGGGLSASQDELGWIQSSYLIAEIIVIPLSAWLSRVMSTRWLIAASAAGFTLASVLCSTAWDIRSMIVFRALQGFFGGAMIPTAFTAAVILFQGKQKAVAASFVSAVAGLAPTLGPVVGGWLTDGWSWHWLFYVNIVPGTLVMLLVPMLVRIDEPDLTLLRDADYLGMILMALFLGCLDYVLEEGARWEWFADDTIKICTAISGLAGIGFIIRSLTYAHPVVDLRALANRNFCLGCLFSFVTGIGMFGLIYLTPLFLGRVRGFLAWQIAGTILSAGLFQLAAIPIYTLDQRF